MAEAKKKEAAEKAEDKQEQKEVSQSPNLRAMYEADARYPSPAEIERQKKAWKGKDEDFEPQMVPGDIPVWLMTPEERERHEKGQTRAEVSQSPVGAMVPNPQLEAVVEAAPAAPVDITTASTTVGTTTSAAAPAASTTTTSTASTPAVPATTTTSTGTSTRAANT